MDRRAFLLGCSAAASPLLTPVTFANAPGFDGKLVVILLRGAMDGLDAVQPVGERDFAALRPRLGTGEDAGALPLDGFFALHPGLGALMQLWEAGELAFAHAVSTPYRDKRSHFDGQDLLEAGVPDLSGGLPRDGWLNRLLQGMPGVRAETAFAVGQGQMRVLAGAAPTSLWRPDTALEVSAQAERLLELIYHDDPLFRDATAQALGILEGLEAAPDAEASEGMMAAMEGARNKGLVQIAEFAAARLREDTAIAAFSLGGWDTHSRQKLGLRRRLEELADAILVLRAGLGPEWGRTAVVAVTEFGRTARENGTGGTDHGTGGAMVLAGGAVRGGRVIGEWPGLAEADLYARRDLMPTRDVRAHLAWLLRGLAGAETARLETEVFPRLDMGADPRLLL
ncbi:MAG: DUF1501 domain-containing protein [Shimia sp.]